ncbi:hypothetical protein [Streptomyces sp. RerS4]|uniref:hypothetical protein n=1 Tax=Streptomyces sp. RerS4 TaxID=2942449 RepID=UPI00201C908E|nr:hypothetical protein [Streptomyces sp. RerS4]UQX04582.1 hypothetical protein M4D82_31765 [Streptomyces sp. RerS4]
MTKVKAAARTMAVATAGLGLALSFAGSAQAAGGSYTARTPDGCGTASGTYHWYPTVKYNNRQAYKTDWDFTVKDNCGANGRSVSMYAKYAKWTGSSWYDDGKYHKIAATNNAKDVDAVRIFVCEVGFPSTCGEIKPK